MTALNGKVAIVTGGGSGIGAATAELMASRGVRVVVAGRRKAPLDEVAARIRAAGGEAEAVSCDIGVEDQIAALVARTVERFGGVNILHANAAATGAAAMAGDKMIADMDADLWDRTMAINLRGPMLCTKHVLPHMLAAGGGAIIYTGSGKGVQGDLNFPAYGASKAGLISLNSYVATQYGKQRIRSNVALVGLVMTETLRQSVPAPVVKMMEEHHLTPYLGDVAHVAEAVAFLASDAAAFITGSVIPVDGGVVGHAPTFADETRMRSSH